MIKCKICKKKFSVITVSHLKLHRWTIRRYTKKFGSSGVGFLIPIAAVPRNDVRYQKWRESLKKRSGAWLRGYTKETHPSVMKISQTMRKRKIDNFRQWREKERAAGRIPKEYPSLIRSGNLAEYIGVVLGDGHIARFPRTERILIFSNSNNRGFVKRYTYLTQTLFNKKPTVYRVKNVNMIRIGLYQKVIAKRLNIPSGSRRNLIWGTPRWILQNRGFLIRYLRGLYEAEGSFCVHGPTSTYKLLFSNRNPSLLDSVYSGLQKLGFHPHRSGHQIQLSKKQEVYKCKELLKFRKYK